MNILETRQLEFAYKKKKILHGVDLAIPQGSIYGYLGKNGAGKSTTIKLLLGLLQSPEKSIFFNGEDINSQRENMLGNIGSLIESPVYYNNLSGREHLQYLDIIFKKGKKRIDEVLEIVGLTAAKNTKVKNYSTGMKQRIGIAMAMYHDPDFLILDEPLNGLDPAAVHEVRELMIRLKDQGKTILLSSHILGEIEKTCTHIGILDQGKLLYQGALSQLLSNITQKVVIRTSNPQMALEIYKDNMFQVEMKEDNKVMISVDNDKEYNEAVKLLVNKQIDIYSMETKENDLESVYLNLISK